MKHMRLFWTVGCWFSLFLLSVYNNMIGNYEAVFPVWYSTIIVWFTGVVALSSLANNSDREFR